MPTLIPRTEAVAILMLAASVLLVVAIAFAFLTLARNACAEWNCAGEHGSRPLPGYVWIAVTGWPTPSKNQR